jgi:hypothetical protein
MSMRPSRLGSSAPALFVATCLGILALGSAVPEAVAAPRSAAPFRVGTAVVNINPSYPVYLGGYGGPPPKPTITRHVDPTTGQAENLTVRAFAIEGKGHAVEFASVDSQGWFAGYQEGPYGITDVRRQVAGWLRAHGDRRATAADIIVSSLHEHAVPTLYGIFGPSEHQLPYLRAVAAGTIQALEEAFARARPARVTWGSTDAPWLAATSVSQGNAFEGWPRDGSLAALWARDATTGATIATFVQESGYPNIVFGPGDLLAPDGSGRAIMSTDFPSYAEHWIEQRLGGVAVLASGSLGNNTGPMQADIAPSPDLPKVGSDRQTRAFDDIEHMGTVLGELTMEALATGRPFTDATVASAEEYLVAPGYNPASIGLTETYNIRSLYNPTLGAAFHYYPDDRSQSPPYQIGSALGTWVTAFRIGGLLFISEPGEYFPSIHTAWQRAVHGAAGVFVIGAAQDFLGYDYPAYVLPFTAEGGDEHVFNPSPTLGDQTVAAGEREARALGFAAGSVSAETTFTDNRYGRALQAGVQLIPFPRAGDIDPATGRWSAVLEGYSTPERASANGVCLAEVLFSVCPGVPTMGPFTWRFGDGTSSVRPPDGAARAYFSLVDHAYGVPGVYVVGVAATSSDGHAAAMSLPVRVFPALRVSATAVSGRLVAKVSGGTGAILLYRWRLADGSVDYGPTIPAPSGPGPVELSVVDGTGTVAAATVRR